MATHPVLWTSPSPLWGRFEAAGANAFRAEDQARPALLRFASDEFMPQVIAMLETDPRRIGETIARPETWRNPSGETPDLVGPPRPQRALRAFARLRAPAGPQGALQTTASIESAKVNGVARDLPLKLYHPAHQRHYLVAASLVCGLPGFPDRTLATGGREQVGFYVRRVLREPGRSDGPEHEYAFVRDARGPHWERVPRDEGGADHYARSARGEEMLPLFPLAFSDDAGHPRRMLAGTVPVGRREEYMHSRRYESALPQNAVTATGSAASDGASAPQTRKSARKEQLKLDVTEPWKALIRAAYKAAERIDEPDPGTSLKQRRDSTTQANEGAQLQSWLILLDFADYLANHVPAVWAAVVDPASSPVLPDDVGQQRLFAWIASAGTTSNGEWLLGPGTSFATSMRDALHRIADPDVRKKLEGAERTFVVAGLGADPWPDFQFLLAGVREQLAMVNGAMQLVYRPAGLQDTLDAAAAMPPATDTDDVEAKPQSTNAETAAAHVDRLVQLVMAAVDADATTPAPPVPFAAQVRDAIVGMNGDDGWFLLRCAYARYDCGALEPAVLSAPSQKFQFASFFDSDAPARPIRIALPLDTTAAGMRKHQKNTAFVISDVLCGQVNRLKGLGFVDLVLSVLPWPFHKDLDIGSDGLGPCRADGGATLGMICSLSIPIITICALILLFMIVLVLDFIFKWIPWFIVCFPLQGIKAKRSS
jgi:hypothetical protein